MPKSRFHHRVAGVVIAAACGFRCDTSNSAISFFARNSGTNGAWLRKHASTAGTMRPRRPQAVEVVVHEPVLDRPARRVEAPGGVVEEPGIAARADGPRRDAFSQ